MKYNRKYRILIEDETTLETKIDTSAKISLFILMSVIFFAMATLLAVLLLWLSPLKNLLPGYLKQSERAATEEQHLRLDSLIKVYEINELYLSSILKALDPPLEPDSLLHKETANTMGLSMDSLLIMSEEEKFFIEEIRERDKFNISVISPLDAETLMFGNLAKTAIISEATSEDYKAEVIIPNGYEVCSVAEGKIISIASSPKTGGGYEVLIQHPKGFLSKTSRLGKIIVSTGEHVSVGQIIGRTSSDGARKSNYVNFELWHDGNPLIPSHYIGLNK